MGGQKPIPTSLHHRKANEGNCHKNLKCFFDPPNSRITGKLQATDGEIHCPLPAFEATASELTTVQSSQSPSGRLRFRFTPTAWFAHPASPPRARINLDR